MSNSSHLHRPPRLAEWFLRKILPDTGWDTPAGDFEESYRAISVESGRQHANIWYMKQIFRLLPGKIANHFYWGHQMLLNYLKTAVRVIKRNRMYSFINIFGLALGMACCVLILLWVQDEINYNGFHANHKNIYRVLNDLNFGPNPRHTAGSAFPVAAELKNDFQEIEESVRFYRSARLLVGSGEKRFYETRFLYTDPSVFTIFSFPFIAGDPETALKSPESLVITEDTARKYFGNADPLGKSILTQNRNAFIVTGVVADVPYNSSIQFDFLAPMERLVKMGQRVHWTAWWYGAFVQLQEGIDYKAVNTKLENWMETKPEQFSRYYLQPLSKIRLYGVQGVGGTIQSVYLFSGLAVLILIIAGINHINLSTARASHRAKEIGLRKTIGAQKGNIIRQFIGESILYAFCSLGVAVILIGVFLPFFDSLSGKSMSENIFRSPALIPGLLILTLLTGLLAGCYPALVLSTFRPVRVLRGSLNSGKKSAILRKILVVTQFFMSIILILGTWVVYSQRQYMSRQDLGFAKDHLIIMELRGEGDLLSRHNTLKSALLQLPGVTDVTGATGLMFSGLPSEFGQLDWRGKDPQQVIEMNHMAVDPDFLQTIGADLKEGVFFSDSSDADAMDFVLNETAVKATGLESPLGERFRLNKREGKIIGVVNDFHFSSLRMKITPLILVKMPLSSWQYSHFVMARIGGDHIQNTLTSIEKTWNAVVPDYPFVFRFLDSRIGELYRSEQSLGRILQAFTILALAISCLGLFGLVSFVVEKRKQEIGIRKAIGASVRRIITLLSREFFILIILANILAAPAGYFIMKGWLKNFAYRIDVSVWMFLLTAAVSIAIGFLTVGYKSLRSALANPAETLRHE